MCPGITATTTTSFKLPPYSKVSILAKFVMATTFANLQACRLACTEDNCSLQCPVTSAPTQFTTQPVVAPPQPTHSVVVQPVVQPTNCNKPVIDDGQSTFRHDHNMWGIFLTIIFVVIAVAVFWMLFRGIFNNNRVGGYGAGGFGAKTMDGDGKTMEGKHRGWKMSKFTAFLNGFILALLVIWLFGSFRR